jgi:hypothetical protein
MTDIKKEPFYELARLAVQAALDAPLRRPTYGAKAGVWWDTIDAIRREADRLGIDWRTQHRQTK